MDRAIRLSNQLTANGVAASTPSDAVKIVSRNNGVAVIQINFPPANGWNEITSTGVANAYAEAVKDQSIKAVVITGTGVNFVAGADINNLAKQQQSNVPASKFVENIMRGHKIINQLESGPKPTVAAINGFALGGGLELALSCNGRVAVPTAAVGLPELQLGIIPGLAGTQRLPRLIGLQAAVPATLTGKHIKAPDALKLGLLDAVVPPKQLIEAASKLALDMAAGKTPRKQVSKLDDKLKDKEGAMKFLEQAKVDAVKRAKGQPQQAAYIEAVRAGVVGGYEAGIQREAELFGELVTGPVSSALVHFFFASRATSKVKDVPTKPSGKPIQKVAVIGGGTMGAGICIAYLLNGYHVVLKEISEELLLAAMHRILDQINRVLKKRKLPAYGAETVLRNFTTTTSYDELKDVDLVIEAVIEKLSLKQSIFADLERVCRKDTILATNTSTIDIVKIGEKTKALDRIVGLHFFSPAHIMPLLEIVRSEHTSAETLALCLQMAKKIKKTPVVAGNCPGFIANRAFFPYGQVAGFLVDAGLNPYEIDAAILKFGMPMGPFRMGDLSGVDVGVNAAQTFLNAYPERTYKSTLAKELVAAGKLGEKTKQGYYKYVNGKAVPDLQTLQPYIEKSRQAGQQHHIIDLSKSGLTERDIQEIMFYPVINECARIVGEGYAQSPADVDVASITGYGYPAHRGGLMWWAASKKPGQGGGYKRVVERLQYFSDTFGKDSPKIKSFFQPSEELKKLASQSN